MNTIIELGGVQLSVTALIMLSAWFFVEVGVSKKFVPLCNIFTGTMLCMLFADVKGIEAVVIGLINGMIATGTFSGGKNTFEGIKEMFDDIKKVGSD